MKTLFSVILFLSFSQLWGQSMNRQVVSAYGSYEESGGLTLSSTVGEVATATYEQADIILTQGFQQPDVAKDTDVSIESVIEGLKISAYPNPTTQKIVLELTSHKKMDLLIQLFDMEGKRLNSKTLNQTTVLGKSVHVIDFKNYASGQYVLTLIEKREGSQTSIMIQKAE